MRRFAAILCLVCLSATAMALPRQFLASLNPVPAAEYLFGTAGEDATGNGRDATFAGGAYAATNTLVLTNVAYYATAADSNDFTPSNAFTVSFWVYPLAGDWTVIGKEGSATDRSWYVRIQTANALKFVVSSNGTAFGEYNSVLFVPPATNWYHVACVYRSFAPPEIWVNGTNTGVGLVGGTAQNTLYNNSSPLMLGGRRDRSSASADFRGLLKRVRVDPYALGEVKIKELATWQ